MFAIQTPSVVIPPSRVNATIPPVVVLFALVTCVFVYWPGLSGPLLLDDHPQLSPLLDLERLEERGIWGFLLGSSGPLSRPVSMASFLFSALTSGDDTEAWKYTNLMIHLLSGVLMVWLSAHLVSFESDSPSTHCWWIGALIATVWLLHPLQVSTVLYTVQRMAQLSCLFMVAGLLTYVIGRKRQLYDRGGHVLIAITFFVFLPLATLSKENGVLLVVLVFLVETFLFRFAGNAQIRRIQWAYFSVFLIVPVLCGLLLLLWHFDVYIHERFTGREYSLEQHVLTQFRVLFLYIYQLMAPMQQNMGFFHDDFVVSKGWFDPASTIVSMLGITSLVVFAWCVRRARPLLGLGILLFFGAHLLESTILPLELVFEHRNYFPSYGLFLAIVGGLAKMRLRTSVGVGLSVVTVLFITVLTSFRVQTWASETSLYSYAYRVHPNSHRVGAQIAEGLTRTGRYDEALSVLAHLEGNGPELQRLYIQCRRKKHLSDEDLSSVITGLISPINNYAVTGIMEVGRLGLDGHCEFSFERYADVLDRVLHLTISDQSSKHKVRIYRAHYLWRLGKNEMALVALEEANRVTPDDPIALFLAAEWSLELNQLERARSYFVKAVEVAESSQFSFQGFIDAIGDALENRESGSSSL